MEIKEITFDHRLFVVGISKGGDQYLANLLNLGHVATGHTQQDAINNVLELHVLALNKASLQEAIDLAVRMLTQQLLERTTNEGEG